MRTRDCRAFAIVAYEAAHGVDAGGRLRLNGVATQTEATVNAGQNATFTFQVKAPATPGVYSIHLRPVIDGTTWMEDEGVFLIITVNP